MADESIRDLVIDSLSEKIGVLGGVIVDDVLDELGLGPDGLNNRSTLTRFLARLKHELPGDLDVNGIIEGIRVATYFRHPAH